MDVISEVEAPL